MPPYRRSSRTDVPARPRRTRRVAGLEPGPNRRAETGRPAEPEAEQAPASVTADTDGAARTPVREARRSATRSGRLPAGPAAEPRPDSAGDGQAGDGQAESGAEDGDTTVPGTPDSGAEAGDTAGWRSRRVVLMAVAAVLLLAVAVVAAVANAQLRGAPAAQNTALVDVGATAQVSGQLGDALERVYSYDFARLDQNEADARAVITEEFGAQFDRLFGQVRELAPQQQAVVTATVTMSAVQRIEGDRATVFVFMDQQATRAADARQLAAAGRLTVTGRLVDGQWKIADVQSR
ncbi:hypothetical protein ACVGVM_04125 [Pseudonocardia bannensis]|uniref:Mce-associated membrane protein n=1 Tax=Pseudonocardia bannensis TaxID=630973 RepID=A0A848DRQ7_9PSEU|nr:hypothetical protein [Pseudonocardia bannensis]NMH95547.1 hypothetical protein [Pseudonocardia bannensis]